jgi:hypothetical protein
MNDRTRTGLEVLRVALVIGVLGDVLLRVVPWGLNVLLFNVAFAVGVFMLLKRRAPERLTAQTVSLLGALVFFASMFVVRDSVLLRMADTVAIIMLLGVLFIPATGIAAKTAGVFHYIVGALWSGLNAMFAPAMLLSSDIEWKAMPASGWQKHTFAVLRGVILVTPLILIFGALFVAADAAYEGWVARVLNIDPATIFTHFLLFGIFAWLSAGYLRGLMMMAPIPVEAFAGAVPTSSDETMVDRVVQDSGEHPVHLDSRTVVEHINISDPPHAETPSSGSVPFEKETTSKDTKKTWTWKDLNNSLLPSAFTIGSVEVGVILGSMNLLFLSFVIVQIPYLFGGMDLVQNTPNFKLAEYARRGFGELVAVSALVLPVLLIGHWLIKRDARIAINLFRVLAAVQIALLFVIMASAVQRLVLLTGPLGYGMTMIRLYPMIFMVWLAILFVWFGATVLRNARQYFAWGALWSAFLVLGFAHVLNPDAFIMQTNLELMRQGREFDGTYVRELSADALPPLLNAFDQLSDADQQEAIPHISSTYCEMKNEQDLRSWNLSRRESWRLLSTNTEFITALGDCDANKIKFVRRED